MIHPSPPARVSPGTNEITQIKPSSAPMTAGAGNVCSSPWTSRTPQHETAEYLAGVGGFHVIMTARGRPVLRDAIAAKTAPLMATDAQSTEYVNDLRGSSIPGRYGHGRESVTFRTPNKLPASDGEPTALPTRRADGHVRNYWRIEHKATTSVTQSGAEMHYISTTGATSHVKANSLTQSTARSGLNRHTNIKRTTEPNQSQPVSPLFVTQRN